jgi:ribosomal protein S6
MSGRAWATNVDAGFGTARETILKTYDAMFIFRSALGEEALDQALTSVRTEITRAGGAILAEARKGKHAFVRPMKKSDAGFYVRLVMRLDPAQVAPLKLRFKLNEGIFRVQIVLAAAAVVADPAGALAPRPPQEAPDNG